MCAAARSSLKGRAAGIAAGRRGLLVLACLAARGSALHSRPGHAEVGHDTGRRSRFERVGTAAFGWSSVLGLSGHTAILTDGQGYRQKLENVEDMQYLSYISLGGQKLAGIMDTGSSDIVVFPKGCSTCGTAVGYDPAASASHTVGNVSQQWRYESGKVDCLMAWDVMTAGPHKGFNQTFWEASASQMELLDAASFQAIIGLTPPRAQTTAVASHGLQGQFGLLATTSERSFSICLGRDMLSEGVFVWNDTSAARHPELFHRVPVIGDGSWSVRATNARFSFLTEHFVAGLKASSAEEGVEHLAFESSTAVDLGCEEGCRIMLDSGASVLGLPGEAVNQLSKIVSRDNINCSNMWELPFITFELNGKTFSLPPDAYLAQTTTQVPSFLQSVAEVRTLTRSTSIQKSKFCQLAVIAIGPQRKAGPLWVLGMPFFRKYYATFSIGDGPEDHAVHLSGKTEECTPTYRNVEVHNGPADVWQRTVDPSKLTPPRSTQLLSGLNSGMRLF